MSEGKEFLTPVGRIVMGDAHEPQTKDADGNLLTVKTGPNAGQPRVQHFIGLAIAKTEPAWPQLWADIYAVARASFPTLFDATGKCLRPDFAFKVIDGDSVVPNSRNVRPCDREGYPGNWILSLSSGFKPACYDNSKPPALLPEGQKIKRGFYVRVHGVIRGNDSSQRPGVYLNFDLIQLCGYGAEIKSGPDGVAIFGAAPVAALPTGASVTPLASELPPQAGQAPGVPMAPGMPTGAAVPAPAIPAGVQPAPSFLQPPAMPSAPAPAPAAPAVARYLGADGKAYTIDQFKAAGWTEAQIATLKPA